MGIVNLSDEQIRSAARIHALSMGLTLEEAFGVAEQYLGAFRALETQAMTSLYMWIDKAREERDAAR